jgi:hypothetical protein
MTSDPTDRLSAKAQFVLVLRLFVEADGNVGGELVDPLSRRRQRFVGLERLADSLRLWIDDALHTAMHEPDRQPNRERTDP